MTAIVPSGNDDSSGNPKRLSSFHNQGYDHHDDTATGRGKTVSYDATFMSDNLKLDLKGWADLRKVG